jgi:hypothetical protein
MKDITENKHGGNANSKAAFGAIKETLTNRQQVVYQLIKRMPLCTSKDIAYWSYIPLNAVSGRLTELKKMGKIKVCGRRDGCAIYQINEP